MKKIGIDFIFSYIIIFKIRFMKLRIVNVIKIVI